MLFILFVESQQKEKKEAFFFWQNVRQNVCIACCFFLGKFHNINALLVTINM
jgi:hypothetical protein